MIERALRVQVNGRDWLVIDVSGDATMEVLIDLENDEWVSVTYEYAPDVEEAIVTGQIVPTEKLVQYARCSCGVGREQGDKADSCMHVEQVEQAYYDQYIRED